jgi:hypothetical protein
LNLQRITPSAPHTLFGCAATRAIEQAALAGLPPGTLMQRAGLAVARLAAAVAPHARRIWIACGPGNNGGDGLEAAAHLQKYLQFLYDTRDKYFGNGRSVRKIIEETVKNRDLRLAAIPKDQRTPDLLGKIIATDVAEFTIAEQTSDTRRRIGFNLPGKS